MYDQSIDVARVGAGFLPLSGMARLMQDGVVVLDLYSTLVSPNVTIGRGTVLYPSSVLFCDAESELTLGGLNTVWGGTLVSATGGSSISIGDGNSLGPGGVQIKANNAASQIVISDSVRLLNGAEIVGMSSLGRGSQVLGQISAQSVVLEGGGDYSSPNPDERGAVLKGSGLARGLSLATGDVLNGLGDFAKSPIERQASYHPGPKR